MNILITLSKELINEILSGNKKFEMRKCIPKNLKIGEDGFFVVEKGTDLIRCWCRVDSIIEGYILYGVSRSHTTVYPRVCSIGNPGLPVGNR